MTILEGIILSIVAFVLGFGLAWLILPRVREEEVVEEKLEKYQRNVEEHLAKTADLLDELTANYKKVHDHLSHSAQTLLSEEQLQKLAGQRQTKGYKILVLENSTVAENNTEDSSASGETAAGLNQDPETKGDSNHPSPSADTPNKS